MSAENSEAVRRQVLETEAILLRAEVARLEAAVFDLTRPPAETAPVLEILGARQPARLAFLGPLSVGPDRFYRVALTYLNRLAASCEITSLDPAEFRRFFEDLARHQHGWEGEKKVASLEGQLAISCTYDGALYRPEVCMEVSCALDLPSFDPYWTVRLRLELDPESLEDLAVRARKFFAT